MECTPAQTCCFTGHRNLPVRRVPVIQEALRRRVLLLLTEGVLYYKVGGAVGFDTLAAEVLLSLRPEHPEMHVALYYPFDGFTAQWEPEQMERYRRLLPCYDEVVCVSPPPKRAADAYLLRDRRLVDGSATVVAYCTRRSGGTAYTLRYAQRAGCRIFNLAGE